GGSGGGSGGSSATETQLSVDEITGGVILSLVKVSGHQLQVVFGSKVSDTEVPPLFHFVEVVVTLDASWLTVHEVYVAMQP
ncbi:hypothetical protein CGJ15_25300, partial [Vibrio parahaemolyticus]